MYKRLFNEQFDTEENSDVRKKTKELLTSLRDENFGNHDQRKKFVHLIVGLSLSPDPIARKAIKRIGDFFTDLANELLSEIKEQTK